ncbi:MAG: hypothetical protein WC026_13215 [Hyphomicrobium sp.]|uniref:hypothetical protein n=1 Tax=Hyphomicrobium sp. TaxID=82 RepID=UPI00356A84B7
MKKKTPPTFPKEFPQIRIQYGSNCDTSGKGMRLKTNFVCPHENCNYTSRNWATPFNLKRNQNQNMFVASTKCPHHNLELVNFGNACKLPKNNKKGRKEKQELIKLYTKK